MALRRHQQALRRDKGILQGAELCGEWPGNYIRILGFISSGQIDFSMFRFFR